MNIRIPHSWLLEHLDTQASPEEIQKYLSLSGPSVERIHEIENEPVYEIEVTVNRVDCMSVRGIAREAAVILTQAGIPSQTKKMPTIGNLKKTTPLPLPTIRNNPTLCKRILCQVLANVDRTPSPEWLQKRLRQIGVNVHDTVIDITNYITHELGHPCHAFDYDSIMTLGGEIIVKEAEPGKKFTIIDGSEFETVGGEIVFENQYGKIIDLPAIKGTKNTSITDQTRNVLFWIETLDAHKVRFASMTHAIRTVAAQLSEKHVDPHLAEVVFERGVELFCELTGAQIASDLYDDFPGKKAPAAIKFTHELIKNYLGIPLPAKQIRDILEYLECRVEYKEPKFIVQPPTFRADMEIPADVVEEVARIYGYHNLPSVLMSGLIPTTKPIDVNFSLEHETKEFLAALGGYEIYTYSLIDQEQALDEASWIHQKRARQEDLETTHIKLSNPLTDELVYLRRSLWTSHVRVLANNPQPKEVTVFEFANTYLPTHAARDTDWGNRVVSPSKDRTSKILPFEEYHLTLTARGKERHAKGMIEALAKKHYLPSLRYIPSEKGPEVMLYAGDKSIGYTQTVEELIVIDVDWKAFLSVCRTYPLYKPEGKYTPIVEDLTFTLPETTYVQRVLETVKNAHEHIAAVNLKDIYKRNVTFSVSYQSEHKQLEASDASAIRKTVVKTVEKEHRASLVGAL